MAFMQEGGLQDEGGTVDKESGNDVPSGSLKKEVRDDVPAMLSEGEFVIPADVVRYIGLNKLMQMRQEAKMGLQMMEKMGQMGNSEEAEIPDDLPFGVTDIVVMGNDDDDDDEKEMAQGGIIYAQEGTDVPSNVNVIGNAVGQVAGFGGGTGMQENSGFMPHMYFYNTETKQYRLLPAGMMGRMSGDTEITQEEYKKAIGNELANERIQEANKVYKNMPQPKPEKDYTQSKEPIPPQVDKYGNPKPRLLGINFELVDGEWVKSGAILPDNMDKYTPQPKPEKDYTQSKEPIAPQPTSEKNYYTDEYGMPMMKLPPQQPQQTDFERMMGYEAGRGDNPYAPSRVAYQNKKGEVVYKLEDYMGRPMESTTGLTRVTPYGPEGDQPTPAPSPDPTPDDGESDADRRQAERKDDRKKAREAERKASRDAQIDKDIKNLQDSEDPRFVGKTGKEARDAYFDLSFKERADMAKEDLAGRPAKLKEDLDSLLEKLPKAVKEIPDVINAIGDVYKDAGIELGRKAKVALGLQEEGAVERASTPPSRPAGLGGEIDDASSLPNPFEGSTYDDISPPNPFKGSTYDDISPPKPMALGQTDAASLEDLQTTARPVGSLPSSIPLPDELAYTQGMQRPSVPSVQPNTTEPAFTEIESNLPNLSQGNNTQGASRLIEGTSRKAISDRQKRDMVRRVNSATREREAEKKRKSNMSKVDKKDRDKFKKRREEADKKESKKSKEKNKKEAANVRDYGISGLKKGGLMKKDYP